MEAEALKKKKIIKVSIVLGVMVIILSFFSKTIAGLSLAKVTVAKGVSGYLEKEGDYDGKATFKKTCKVFAPIQGDMTSVDVQVGDKVKKGQRLCLIDAGDTRYEMDKKKLEIEKGQLSLTSLNTQLSQVDAQISKAQGKLAKANEKLKKTADERKSEAASSKEDENTLDLAQAEKTLSVDEVLFEEGSISQEELDKAKAAVEKIKLKIQEDKKAKEKENTTADEARQTSVDTQQDQIDTLKNEKTKILQSIEAGKLELAAAQLDLEQLEKLSSTSGEILAEEDGVVLALSIDKGQHVASKQEMMQLGSLADGETVEFMVEKEMNILKVEDEINLSIEAIDQTGLTGKIASIKKEDNGLKVTADFKCEDIKGGEGVSVHIHKEADEACMLIPYNALNKDKNIYFVYTAEPCEDSLGAAYRIRKVNVHIGEHSLDLVEIKEGLSDSSCVVISSEKELKEGMNVKVENEGVFYDETNK